MQGVVDSTLTFATNLTIGQSGFAWLNSTDILATDGFSNNGETRVTGDSVLFADVTNEGLMAVHLGTLYLIGDLTNNGALVTAGWIMAWNWFPWFAWWRTTSG